MFVERRQKNGPFKFINVVIKHAPITAKNLPKKGSDEESTVHFAVEDYGKKQFGREGFKWDKKVVYLSGHIFNYNTDDKDKDDAQEYFQEIQMLKSEESFFMMVAEKVIYFPYSLFYLFNELKQCKFYQLAMD